MKKLFVTLSDENYLEKAKQLFASAYFNGGWDGDFMLLAYNIPEEKLESLRKKGIIIRKCSPIKNESDIKLYYDYKEKEWVNIVLNKFFLFTEEFKKWDIIIFSDADIIILRSLKKLNSIKGFFAARDFLPRIKDQFVAYDHLNNEEKSLYKKLELNFNFKKIAFNSGFMVFSSDIIKKDTFNKLNHLQKKYINISHLGDQGILNIFFYKKWKELPLVYNPSSYFFKDKIPIKTITIHTNYKIKAWDKESIFYHEWIKNLRLFDSINELPSKEIIMKNGEIRFYSKKLKKLYGELDPLKNNRFSKKLKNKIKEAKIKFTEIIK
ncbi:MAG: glycosyltransferase [Candidatus Pacearchaeota archaeon]|jgi:lipopolysaccharide biosynthesis glycosyltransferase